MLFISSFYSIVLDVFRVARISACNIGRIAIIIIKMTPQRTRNSCACALLKSIYYLHYLHYYYWFKHAFLFLCRGETRLKHSFIEDNEQNIVHNICIVMVLDSVFILSACVSWMTSVNIQGAPKRKYWYYIFAVTSSYFHQFSGFFSPSQSAVNLR